MRIGRGRTKDRRRRTDTKPVTPSRNIRRIVSYVPSPKRASISSRITRAERRGDQPFGATWRGAGPAAAAAAGPRDLREPPVPELGGGVEPPPPLRGLGRSEPRPDELPS